MKRPFDFIDGENLDINNPTHRKVVVDRDKKLNTAVKQGMDLMNVSTKVVLHIEFDCLSCGSPIQADNQEKDPFLDECNLFEILPSERIICGCCGTTYKSYYNEAEDTNDESEYRFKVKVPKPENKVLKL